MTDVTTAPQAVLLTDYRTPAFLVEQISLDFQLHETATQVTSIVHYSLNPDRSGIPESLILYGEDLRLDAIAIDGEALTPDHFIVSDGVLEIPVVPQSFELSMTTIIDPQNNTSLEGLYLSNGNFCTQCEAEGFRKITYYPDRPDVLTTFRVRIEAEKNYPVLLSNGNLVESGTTASGRHFTIWEDPFRKPSYLFALVAGDLVCIEGHHKTPSGRDVLLQIFVEERNRDYCDHAMRSLQKAMQWDEEVFGLEYDLDRYMIVAVDDFNMGAMENKGLNVFNSKYVLAHPETATDADFLGVESVIGHEYFHNWTGNRVTCRDWFQLSLKEGLTVFRDQEFSADLNSAAVKRIDDVRVLRQFQFPEDAGPMAHPIRPSSYVEINNFYTTTIYNKGAEVIRMMQTLLGKDRFIAGVQSYLQKHDGQAATCDDFVAAMEVAGGIDLSQFKNWYHQAGTPHVSYSEQYDARTETLTLNVSQTCSPTPGQEVKQPFHLPLVVGLLDNQGNDIPLQLAGEDAPTGTSRTLELKEATQQFVFENISCRPVVSLLREFSAPVVLRADVNSDDLAFRLAHDSDEFNRWEAGQQLATRELLANYELVAGAPEQFSLSPVFSKAWSAALADYEADSSLLTQLLVLPNEQYLADQLDSVDPGRVYQVRQLARKALAEANQSLLKERYLKAQRGGVYSLDPGAVGERSLANFCLGQLLLAGGESSEAMGLEQYHNAANMTDRLAAFSALVNSEMTAKSAVIDDFYHQWQAHPLLLDKWFSLQALAQTDSVFADVQRLLSHPKFSYSNPNRVRSLIGAFSQNLNAFHRADGLGYKWLADQILLIDARNAQLSARLAGPFTRWKRLEAKRQALMRGELERISGATLSKDLYEIVSKSLS